jgi:hypothetical protein
MMAKTDNLIDFLTSIADTIRTKENTSEPINPQDFDSRILSLGDTKVQYIEEYGSGVLNLEYIVDFEPFIILLCNNDDEKTLQQLATSIETTSRKVNIPYKIFYGFPNFAENQTYSLASYLYYTLEGEKFYSRLSSTQMFKREEITEGENVGKWKITMNNKKDTDSQIFRIVNAGQYPLQIMFIGR